jgi:TRAP-type C4-dicarboxylate transport system permease small subunit
MFQSLLLRMDRLSRNLGKIEMVLSCSFLLLMVAIVGISVFLRYVLKSPLIAGMNFATLLLVWMSFFGASFVYREKGHIALEFIVNRFPDTIRRSIMVSIYGVVAITLITTVVQSGYLIVVQWKQQIVALGIPRSFLSLPIGITGILMILTTLNHILSEFRTPPKQ